MADSLPCGRSIDISADTIPDNFCEMCNEETEEVNPMAEYSHDYGNELCPDCFSSPHGSQPFRNHELVDKSTRQNMKSTCQLKSRQNDEEQLLAPNINVSQEQETQNNKLDPLNEGFNDNLGCKTGTKSIDTKSEVLHVKENTCSMFNQMTKVPTHLKDIIVKSSSEKPFNLLGSVLLQNNQILITDCDNCKVKLIDTNQDKVVSELKLSGHVSDATKVKENEVAVIVDEHEIQLISVYQQTLSKGRTIYLSEKCSGIAYNDKNQVFIVSFFASRKVEILNMSGKVIKCLEKDIRGDPLFSWPDNVAVTPDMRGFYVTDRNKNAVTLMTMNGKLTHMYTHFSLKCPQGICVHNSDLVYVVGIGSNTVHQLDPRGGNFKILLDKKDGLDLPTSISYCHREDKMYIGMCSNNVLKVFQMKTRPEKSGYWNFLLRVAYTVINKIIEY